MFKTERCSLSIFQEPDWKEVSKLFINPQVRRYLGGVRNTASIKDVMSDMLAPQSGSYFWVVREESTEEFIGLISLDPHHDGIDQEISFQFLPDWWGKGYAAEAVSMILDFALEKLKLPTVVAETQSANISSCRLLEKLGMELERKIFRYGAEQSLYAIRRLKSEEAQGLVKTASE